MTNVDHYFKHHPASVACFTTSDGYVFHDRPMAESHAASLATKTVNEHSRRAATEQTDPKAPPLTAAELTRHFAEAQTREELASLLPEGEVRKTVLGAYEKRLEELSDAE